MTTDGNEHVAMQGKENIARHVNELLRQYRSMQPVSSLLQYLKHCPEWTSLETQNSIVHNVIQDEICDKYPPEQKYTYRFLKSYIQELEKRNADIDDELASLMMEFIYSSDSQLVEADDMHHVTYSVPTSQSYIPITCRVASMTNEVGLKIWQAAWFLAEYVLANPDTFQEKVVLELGAGVGFSGLVLASCLPSSHPSKVILTDYAQKVVQNLRYNVEINASRYHCPVSVASLDWETWHPNDGVEDESYQESSTVDVLLAADCVYDVSVFPHLTRVLMEFLKGGNRIAFFASTIRNRDTFNAFLEQLQHSAIVCDDITESAMTHMQDKIFGDYDGRSDIRLCRLARNE